MSSHVLVLRSFSGMSPGEVIDTTNWVTGRSASLEEDRYIKTLEHVDAAEAGTCPGECGLTVLVESHLHDCDGLRRQRAEKVAEKVAHAQAAAVEKAEKAAAAKVEPKKVTV